jgi:hypothetical protein
MPSPIQWRGQFDAGVDNPFATPKVCELAQGKFLQLFNFSKGLIVLHSLTFVVEC